MRLKEKQFEDSLGGIVMFCGALHKVQLLQDPFPPK